MQYEQDSKDSTKTIRISKVLVSKIEELAKESERDFSSQVRFILKEYIRQKETK